MVTFTSTLYRLALLTLAALLTLLAITFTAAAKTNLSVTTEPKVTSAPRAWRLASNFAEIDMFYTFANPNLTKISYGTQPDNLQPAKESEVIKRASSKTVERVALLPEYLKANTTYYVKFTLDDGKTKSEQMFTFKTRPAGARAYDEIIAPNSAVLIGEADLSQLLDLNEFAVKVSFQYRAAANKDSIFTNHQCEGYDETDGECYFANLPTDPSFMRREAWQYINGLKPNTKYEWRLMVSHPAHEDDEDGSPFAASEWKAFTTPEANRN